jgi:hypothetical protein
MELIFCELPKIFTLLFTEHAWIEPFSRKYLGHKSLLRGFEVQWYDYVELHITVPLDFNPVIKWTCFHWERNYI